MAHRAIPPIGVCLGTVGATFGWWRDSAVRLEAAGYEGVWSWDHFIGRGDRTRPVLEAWTTLTATAGVTRRLGVGTFVANVMNRHPAVLARMAATLQEASGGRFTLGIGIGGHPAEHEALGIPFPDPPERAERLEEAVAVIRLLFGGGPVSYEGRHYRLIDAYARPVPAPVPRIIVGGETVAGARLAARIGDGWTTFIDRFQLDLPVYLDALAEAGRERVATTVLVGVQGRGSLAAGGWLDDPLGSLDALVGVGADGVILTARSEEDVAGLLRAAERW